MKIFSEFEKDVMRKLVDLQKETNLIKPHNILNGPLKIKSQLTIIGHDYKYELKADETYYYRIEIEGEEIDVLNDYSTITSGLYEANSLIDFLMQDGYLLRHEGGKSIGLLVNMQDDILGKKKEYYKTDLWVNKQIKEFLEKCDFFYQPTEALRDLVKYKFKTKEERISQWTRLLSVISIGISLLGFLLNLYINTRSVKGSGPQIVRFDERSIDYYLKNMRPKIDTVVVIEKVKPRTDSVIKIRK